MIAILSLLWGGSFFFIAIAAREWPPFTVVLVRVGGGAVVLAGVALAIGHKVPRSARAWGDYAVMAVLANVLPFVLIVFAQTLIASGIASVLNASAPLWTVLIAHAFGTSDKLTAQRVAGVGVGIAGVAVLVGPAAFAGQQTSVTGMLAMIVATMSYGFAALWGRRFQSQPVLVTAAGQLVCAALIVLPLAMVIDKPWTLPVPSLSACAAMAGLAVLSTALAFVIFFQILAEVGGTNAMLVTLLVPLSATALGVLVLHEPLTGLHIAGGALIALALLIIDGRVWAMIMHRWP